MSDEDLRRLERAAMEGDATAAERLKAMRARIGLVRGRPRFAETFALLQELDELFQKHVMLTFGRTGLLGHALTDRTRTSEDRAQP